MIRIDAIWMSTQPLDMRVGMESALARVVAVFGAAHPHEGLGARWLWRVVGFAALEPGQVRLG